MSTRLCFCLLLLGVQNAMPTTTKPTGCPENGEILINRRESNDTIQGWVAICEDSVWKAVCDDYWTREDATVACRDQGYSDLNAATYSPNVDLRSSVEYSRYQYACSGSEAKLSECSREDRNTSDCSVMTIGVQCYYANFTETDSTTSTTSTNLQPSSTLTYATTTAHHVTQSPLLQATEPTENSPPSLPIYIYATIGVVAILTVAVCMVVVFIVCRCARRKPVISPKNGIPPEESLYCDLNESQIIKGTHDIVQHHVYHEVAASCVPVYEDIKPVKDNSSKDSDIPILEPCDCGGDRSSQQNGGTQLQYATPESNFSRQGTTENTAMQQQGSFSHNKPPPTKEKTCAPYAVNPLAFQKSPTEKEFNRKVSNDYTTAASSLGEQQGNHEYAVLEGPTEHDTTDSTLHNGHYPLEGELVGGHHYAILEHNHT